MWARVSRLPIAVLGLFIVPALVQAEVVEYQLRADLDVVAGITTGRGQLRWWNRTSEPVSRLVLDPRGATVTAVTLDGDDLGPELSPPAAESGPAPMVLPVPAPIQPGSSVVLGVEWRAPMTTIAAATTGSSGWLVSGAWYPRLSSAAPPDRSLWTGSDRGADAYGELGRFRVSVSLPADWEVASTGLEVRSEPDLEDGRVRVLLAADGVRDFRWCAAPRDALLILDEEFDPLRDVPIRWLLEAADTLEVSAAELELAPVHLRVLAAGGDRASARRALEAARAGLAWTGLWQGPYPHPRLTLVIAPDRPETVSGPMLLGVPPSRGVRTTAPLGWPVVEATTVRALSRQILEGMAAPVDGVRRTIDRGLAIHTEISWLVAGDAGPAWREDRVWTRERLALAHLSPVWRLDRRPDGGAAGHPTDDVRPGLVMRSVQGLLGARVFARAVRTYVQRCREPDGGAADLFSVAAEVSGIELREIVDRLVLEAGTVDWGVVGIEQQRVSPDAGSARESWVSALDLARHGSFPGPVVVRLRWADGREERRLWQADEPRALWRVPSPTPLTEVAIDPDGIWALEVRRADNYWCAEPSRTAARALWRILGGAQLLSLVELPWG